MVKHFQTGLLVMGGASVAASCFMQQISLFFVDGQERAPLTLTHETCRLNGGKAEQVVSIRSSFGKTDPH